MSLLFDAMKEQHINQMAHFTYCTIHLHVLRDSGAFHIEKKIGESLFFYSKSGFSFILGINCKEGGGLR